MSYYQYYHDTFVHGYEPQKLELPFLQNISMSWICLFVLIGCFGRQLCNLDVFHWLTQKLHPIGKCGLFEKFFTNGIWSMTIHGNIF
jgi:hypothetical protein